MHKYTLKKNRLYIYIYTITKYRCSMYVLWWVQVSASESLVFSLSSHPRASCLSSPAKTQAKRSIFSSGYCRRPRESARACERMQDDTSCQLIPQEDEDGQHEQLPRAKYTILSIDRQLYYYWSRASTELSRMQYFLVFRIGVLSACACVHACMREREREKVNGKQNVKMYMCTKVRTGEYYLIEYTCIEREGKREDMYIVRGGMYTCSRLFSSRQRWEMAFALRYRSHV